MSQSILRMLFFAVHSCCAALSGVAAEQPAAAVGEGSSAALRQTAMPEMGGGRLGEILNRYYQKGLGGSENWEKVVSLRVSGRLVREDGKFKFAAYRKKPNYSKMSIFGKQRRVEMGYDGRTAWQVVARGATAVKMAPAQARHFIHDAQFWNYLLFPDAQGKEIIYLDTLPVGGAICHQVRVTLDSGYQVDYFIDIHTHLENKIIHTDIRSGKVTSFVYQDYVRAFGMLPIARKVVRSENGVWVSTLNLDEVKVNSGVMPWMFKMPE